MIFQQARAVCTNWLPRAFVKPSSKPYNFLSLRTTTFASSYFCFSINLRTATFNACSWEEFLSSVCAVNISVMVLMKPTLCQVSAATSISATYISESSSMYLTQEDLRALFPSCQLVCEDESGANRLILQPDLLRDLIPLSLLNLAEISSIFCSISLGSVD